MALQIAFGGGKNQYLSQDNGFFLDPESSDYYESSYNVFFPIEFQISSSLDTLYFLLRKRDNDFGLTFSAISPSDFEISVKDATTGTEINSYSLSSNTINTDWNGINYPLVLTVDNVDSVEDPTLRVRNLDIVINEKSTNDSVVFRVHLEEDESQPFHYLLISERFFEERKRVSAADSEGVVSLKPGLNYIIVSPGASFNEVKREEGVFSYPFEQTYYSLQKRFNDENFTWSIGSVSHEGLRDVVSIRSAPTYAKAGIVFIDGYTLNLLKDTQGLIYFDVKAKADMSETEDVFRFYIKKFKTVNASLL